MLLKVALFLVLVTVCEGSKILVVFPTPDKSVSSQGASIVRTLLSAGHEVIYVTAFPERPAENLTYVDISSVEGADAFRPNLRVLPLAPLTPGQALKRGVEAARRVLLHEAVQELIVDTTVQFDLVFVHWAYSTLMAPLSAVYHCPLVWYVAADASGALRLVHEEASAAYSVGPHTATAPIPPFTVKERTLQLWLQFSSAVMTRYYTDYVELPLYEKMYAEPLRVRGKTLVPYEQVVASGSLLLVDSHPPLGQLLPLPPNVRLLGGHHLDLPLKSLSKEFQAFLDSAKHGVILIDLGANVRSENIPKHVSSRLLEMFGELQQAVVWRLDAPPPHRPANVRVLDRLPTLGVLCHPSTSILITDGSSPALMESVHCGVPVVVVPFSDDQFLNSDLVVARGIARRVDFSHHFAWKLHEAIRDILANYSYRNNAQEASTIFRLRPQPAPVELVHWVQVAIDTGARHLRSPALELTLLERWHLDIWLLAGLTLWFLSKVLKVIRVHLTDYDYDKKDN